MRFKMVFLSILFSLSVNGSQTIGKEPYVDRKFKDTTKAYTNVFELLKRYDKQTEAPGQVDDVHLVRYYESNQRYVGYTNKASAWFSMLTEDELKQLLVKLINRFSSGSASGIVDPIRIIGGIGFYLRDSSCTYIIVFKRIGGPTGYDNDYGDPDFLGRFRICSGLTVTPEQFIKKIGLADDDAEARYLLLISKTSALALLNKPEKNNLQENTLQTRQIAAQWNGISQLIVGEISFKKTAKNGRIKLTLPNELGQCNGTYIMTEQRRGAWSVACTNGMTASGILVAYRCLRNTSDVCFPDPLFRLSDIPEKDPSAWKPRGRILVSYPKDGWGMGTGRRYTQVTFCATNPDAPLP